jgi:hypothetical protein
MIKRGARVLVMLAGEQVAAEYLNPLGPDSHMVRLFGEHRQGPTDSGLRATMWVQEIPKHVVRS